MRGQNVQFGFGKGIDEKLDPKLAPPGTLVGLKNSRQQKTGRIDRRYGSSGGTTVMSACFRMFAREQEQCAIGNVGGVDPSLVFSNSPATGNFVQRDNISEAAARRDPVKALDTIWLDPTVAYSNGMEVWAWRTNEGALTDGTIYAMVRDGVTGAILSPDQAVSVAPVATRCVTPRLLIIGTKAILVYGSASSGAIYARVMDLTNTNAGWGAQTALRADADTSANGVYFDVCVVGTNFVLFYWSTQGTKLQLYSYNSALAQQATQGVTEASTGYSSLAVAVDPTNASLFIAMGQTGAAGGKLRTGVCNATTLATTVAMYDLRTPGTVQSMQAIGIAVRSLTSALIVGQWLNPNSNPTEGFICTSGGASASVGSVPWVQILSKPFVQGTAYYQLCAKSNQNTHYLVCWAQAAVAGFSPLRVVAVVAPQVAHNASASNTDSQNHLRDVATPSPNAYILPTGTIADAASKQHVNLWRARFDFADRWLLAGDQFSIMRWASGQLGLSTHFSGGFSQDYDGNAVTETSCLEQIDSTQVTLTNAAGGGLAAGTYLYSFYWEWSDGQGQIHRSVPSTPLSITVNLNDKVTCKVPSLTFTNMGRSNNPFPKPYLVVCRTPVNGLSTAIYRSTMPDDIIAGAANLNDPTAAYVTVPDTIADGVLTTHPLMYTASGALENTNPGALHHLCIHRNRIYAIGDDGKTIYASTQFVTGEAVRFNVVLTMQVEDYALALASLDDKLVIFGERKVWIVYGDGPNELGTQSDWTTPFPLPGSVGSVDPHSVVKTHEGIYFLSRKGMRVLGRNLEFSNVKQPTDTLAANPCITDATTLANVENVMWACRPAPGAGTGVRLVFDDYHNTWSTDLMAATGANSGTAVACFAIFQGKLYWATDAGLVFYEDPTTWLDGGNWYDSSWETAWISSQGPMGFQRIRVCQVNGDRFTNHDFKLSLAIDYNAYTQSFQWTAARLSTWGRDELELRVGSQNGMNPRCRAIRMKGEILTPTNPGSFPIGTGQAAQFSGIGFEIVPLPGQKRLGKANAAA